MLKAGSPSLFSVIQIHEWSMRCVMSMCSCEKYLISLCYLFAFCNQVSASWKCMHVVRLCVLKRLDTVRSSWSSHACMYRSLVGSWRFLIKGTSRAMAQPADHVSLSITSIKLALESEKPGARLRSSAHSYIPRRWMLMVLMHAQFTGQCLSQPALSTHPDLQLCRPPGRQASKRPS